MTAKLARVDVRELVEALNKSTIELVFDEHFTKDEGAGKSFTVHVGEAPFTLQVCNWLSHISIHLAQGELGPYNTGLELYERDLKRIRVTAEWLTASPQTTFGFSFKRYSNGVERVVKVPMPTLRLQFSVVD